MRRRSRHRRSPTTSLRLANLLPSQRLSLRRGPSGRGMYEYSYVRSTRPAVDHPRVGALRSAAHGWAVPFIATHDTRHVYKVRAPKLSSAGYLLEARTVAIPTRRLSPVTPVSCPCNGSSLPAMSQTLSRSRASTYNTCYCQTNPSPSLWASPNPTSSRCRAPRATAFVFQLASALRGLPLSAPGLVPMCPTSSRGPIFPSSSSLLAEKARCSSPRTNLKGVTSRGAECVCGKRQRKHAGSVGLQRAPISHTVSLSGQWPDAERLPGHHTGA